MQIENDLIAKIGDGELVFDEPGLNDWTLMLAMEGKSLDEQADFLLPKLKAVTNLTYRDGSPVTLDDLKAKKFSARFAFQLMRAWTQGVVDGIKGEADQKNG